MVTNGRSPQWIKSLKNTTKTYGYAAMPVTDVECGPTQLVQTITHDEYIIRNMKTSQRMSPFETYWVLRTTLCHSALNRQLSGTVELQIT